MQLRHYKDLNDLPIRNWFKVHREKDYGFLLENHKELNDEEMIEALLLWDVLNNQFIDRFGLSDEFMQEQSIRNTIAEHMADHIISGDNYYRTLIKVEEVKLKMFTSSTDSEQSLERTLAKMSKAYKFKLESKGLTVEQFYSYLYELTDGKKV